MAEDRTGEALVYIPDITGFTNFVGKTEISHSAHIIRELLELIMEENILDMQVSEVEGDAVLFYRFGEQPSVEELQEQSERIFKKFHTHLKRYDRDRVCQCGACSAASELSVKFVAHYGNIQQVQVGAHSKLMGPCVITSHRLLKNSIGKREYLLVSEALASEPSWKSGTDQYDDSEPIKYAFLDFEDLIKEVPDPPALPEIDRIENPVVVQIAVDAPLQNVQRVITDIDLKPLVTPNVRRIEYTDNIPQVGTQHQCVLENKELDFLAIYHKKEKDRYEYAERLTSAPFIAPGLTFLFIMESMGENSTRLRAELHYKKILGGLLNFLIRPLLKQGLRKGAPALKKFMEQFDPDGQRAGV